VKKLCVWQEKHPDCDPIGEADSAKTLLLQLLFKMLESESE